MPAAHLAPLPRAGAALLIAPNPRKVLQRLTEGDPFHLGERCHRRLVERALILDVQRLQARALALCAWMARDFDGSQSLQRWVEERIDEAIAQLLEQGSLATPAPLASTTSPVSTTTCHVAGVGPTPGWGPSQVRRATARFNRCPEQARHVLLELAKAGASFDELARRQSSNWSSIARLGREALQSSLPSPKASHAADRDAPACTFAS